MRRSTVPSLPLLLMFLVTSIYNYLIAINLASSFYTEYYDNILSIMTLSVMTQHDDRQLNVTQRNDTFHNDTLQNDT